MKNPFRLLMISAMYENGGNTTHRFLDGHSQMYVYPFESQLGTKLVNDALTSMFPAKYRWPEFRLDASAAEDYQFIIDEETKVRARTPSVSKFRSADFQFSNEERKKIYQDLIRRRGRSRANNVAAFFQSTFMAWKNYRCTGKEKVYVGYSPVVLVDAEKILQDFPSAHVLHVVRNPWSAYADTKKRPVPLSLENYFLGWNLNQYFALLFKKKYPRQVHIVRLEDVLKDPRRTLGRLCKNLGLKAEESLSSVSWNGAPLREVYPWGTIHRATAQANKETAQELSRQEKNTIKNLTWQYLKVFGYENFVR